MDGDTLLDGEDDQDNDDWSNISELYETEYDLDGNGNPTLVRQNRPVIPSLDRGGVAWAVNAYNPCAPDPDVAQLPDDGTRPSTSLPAVPPPTWRPHPRL